MMQKVIKPSKSVEFINKNVKSEKRAKKNDLRLKVAFFLNPAAAYFPMSLPTQYLRCMRA